jgi:exonuclease SbcD
MRLLHTADWHLGDRLSHIDRTEDLRRAVERVAGYCLDREVEVLLVAGDLFSERSRADGLRDSVGHLHQVLRPFLDRRGTVLALTGNHDNETFCRTMGHAMALAAPGPTEAGTLVPGGRFYLAAGPTFFRLRDRDGQEVQFVLMPYPTEHRYLNGAVQTYNSLEEKHRALQTAYTGKLGEIRVDPAFRRELPTVLAAHVHVKGSVLPHLFRITEEEDVLFTQSDLPTDWAYVALGHIHQPQCLMGMPHVRYSGSIERLDLGEGKDDKSVALVDIGPHGLRGAPELLPLEATPFQDLVITNLKEDLPRLRAQAAGAASALVRCQVHYRAGTDDLNAALRELRALFPRCYQIHWCDAGTMAASERETASPLAAKGMRATVLEYLNAQLADHQDREEVVRLAETLLLEDQA